MKVQKFHKGDLVHVAKDLGRSMRHFTADIDAIVIGSYDDQYGGGSTDNYTLFLKGHGRCSWYYEGQLELIEANRPDLLEQWEREKAEEIQLKGGRDWIFEHGPEILLSPHGASIETLGRDLGCEDLWGSHGEGFTYAINAAAVMSLASFFLEKKDKEGWLKFAEEFKTSVSTTKEERKSEEHTE
jgi:hypothetical protein